MWKCQKGLDAKPLAAGHFWCMLLFPLSSIFVRLLKDSDIFSYLATIVSHFCPFLQISVRRPEALKMSNSRNLEN